MTDYPSVAFHFQVKIVGDTKSDQAFFQEVSGLSAEMDVEDIQEGGENRFVHKLPKQVKHTNLVLKRGIVQANAPLLTWAKETLESDLTTPIHLKDLQVTLLNETQTPVIGWHFSHAWPVKWSVATFDAMQNEIAIETLEFAYSDVLRRT